MVFPIRLRSAVLVVFMLVSTLGLMGALSKASQAAPGSPGTPQPGSTIAVEDFERGQGSQLTGLRSYTGRGGASFWADPPYGQLGSCLALLGSMQWPPTDPNPTASGCDANVDGGWGTHRSMAGHLGTFGDGDADQNHALTFVGNGRNGTTGRREIATITGSTLMPFDNPTHRHLALGFDILGRTTGSGPTCAPREIKVSAELLFRDAQGQNPYHTDVLSTANPCDSPDQTFPGAPAGSFVAKRFVTTAVPVSDTYERWGYRLKIETDFHPGTAGSHDSTLFALDNVRLIDASPQLDQSFSPTTVNIGATAKLTYTITNTSELSEKQDLSLVNTLPAGLRVATPSNATNNCGGSPPTVSSQTTISAHGGLAPGQAACTISIDVTSATAATYTNQPSDFATLANLQAPSSASVTFAESPDVSITKTALDPSTGDPVTTYAAGSDIDFRLAVENHGDGDATGLTVTDHLPPGFRPVGAAGSSWDCTITGQLVECTRPSLTMSTTTITIHAAAASYVTGEQANTAEVTADHDANPENNSSTVALRPVPKASPTTPSLLGLEWILAFLKGLILP